MLYLPLWDILLCPIRFLCMSCECMKQGRVYNQYRRVRGPLPNIWLQFSPKAQTQWWPSIWQSLSYKTTQWDQMVPCCPLITPKKAINYITLKSVFRDSVIDILTDVVPCILLNLFPYCCCSCFACLSYCLCILFLSSWSLLDAVVC